MQKSFHLLTKEAASFPQPWRSLDTHSPKPTEHCCLIQGEHRISARCLGKTSSSRQRHDRQWSWRKLPVLTRYRESENLEMEKPIRLSCASLGAGAALLPVVNVLVLCPIPFSMCRLIGLSPLPRGIYATARLCSLAGWFSQSSPRIIPSLIPVHYSVGTRVLQSSFSVPASGWREFFAARHSNFKNKRRMSSP